MSKIVKSRAGSSHYCSGISNDMLVKTCSSMIFPIFNRSVARPCAKVLIAVQIATVETCVAQIGQQQHLRLFYEMYKEQSCREHEVSASDQ